MGVVGDVKDHPESDAAVPAFYLSLSQIPQRQVTLEQGEGVGRLALCVGN